MFLTNLVVMKRIIIAFTIYFLLRIFVSDACFAQDVPSIVDTSRYFPDVEHFEQTQGWQITNRKVNLHSRQAESQTIMNYRYLVDMQSAPRTALSFQVAVTKIRHAEIPEPRTGTLITRAQYAYSKMYESSQVGYFRGAEPAKYGDESFTARKDSNSYHVFVRRGDYLIDIRGADILPNRYDKPSVEKVAHYIADFIDSRIFGVRIGIFKPIQVLNDKNVPLIAGKKMVIYATVETERDRELPDNYVFKVKVGRRGFNRTSYDFPLDLSTSSNFDPVGDTTDGVLWEHEHVEPVKIDRVHASFFRIKQESEYRSYMYRLFLDPIKPDFYGDYVFRVTVVDQQTGSKLREHVYRVPCRQSKKLRIAVMPLPVGYWAPPDRWKVEDWSWMSKLGDQGWYRTSFIGMVAPLPENIQKKFTMYPRVRKYLLKNLPKSRGKRRYMDLTRKGRDFLKAVMPVAEENLEFYIYDRFPEDLVVEPHPTEVRLIVKALERWRKKHPRFDRVIGIAPGSNPLEGGVSFYLENDAGRQFWFKKNNIVISVNAPAFQFAHDIAHTFGAYDEWMPRDSEMDTLKQFTKPINKPLGTDSGQLVSNGYWPQKKKFMGTPQRSVNSIMGIEDPAWIPANVYKGILKKLMGG